MPAWLSLDEEPLVLVVGRVALPAAVAAPLAGRAHLQQDYGAAPPTAAAAPLVAVDVPPATAAAPLAYRGRPQKSMQ